ncbi:MAG TPA: ATP-binding protein [Abditibacteriaceae bacterium]
MSLSFQKATKRSARLRMALIGVAGSGKTYTALSIARHLGKRIAVLDTERGSASKYSDVFEFDVMEPETFSPQTYIDAIAAAEEAGYDVLIIDSLSHAWTGKEGALDQVDRAARRNQSGNTFGAWRDVTPRHNAMVDAIIGARLHIIATMRAKTDYVQEKNDKTGKTSVRKVGMAPVQRDGLEYEFDVVADLDQDNNLIVGKTRCPMLAGTVVNKAGREIASKLNAWLEDGVSAPAPYSANNGAANTAPQVATRPAPEVQPSNGAATDGAAETDPYASSGRGNRIRAAAAPEQDDAFESSDVETVECDCGIAARYVQGRSGSGWVCGHFGTGQDTCGFRIKDLDNDAAEDPFGDGASSDATNCTVEEHDEDTLAAPRSGKSSGKAKAEYSLNGSAR